MDRLILNLRRRSAFCPLLCSLLFMGTRYNMTSKEIEETILFQFLSELAC